MSSCGRRYNNDDEIFTTLPDNDVRSMPKPYPYPDEFNTLPVPEPDDVNTLPDKPVRGRPSVSRKSKATMWVVIVLILLLLLAAVYFWQQKKSTTVIAPQVGEFELYVQTPTMSAISMMPRQ
jgi:hypothetical protein